MHCSLSNLTLREYRQIQQFPPLPKVPDIDFQPWSTYQSQAYELYLYGNPTNEAAQPWADWISKTEQYLLQEHPWAAQGRGTNLQAIKKTLGCNHTHSDLEEGQTSLLGAAQSTFPASTKTA